jgi:uncharacterized membrane protein
MAIGPVQLIVLGFNHPEFHGEIIAELERLRESDTVRVIDSLAVHKDANGNVEVAHLSNLTDDEAIELGSKAAALILLEHHWAVPLRDAIVRAGGFRLSDGFISPLDLVAIGLVSAEEARDLHALETAAAPAAR